MEHEYYAAKDKLKAENISFENMNYTENKEIITEMTTEIPQHQSKNSIENENKNTNNYITSEQDVNELWTAIINETGIYLVEYIPYFYNNNIIYIYTQKMMIIKIILQTKMK